jgi:hypothetical protein
MVERKTKMQVVPGGPFVDAVEVPVSESSEKWSEYKLDDGTTIRLKQVMVEVLRATEHYDSDGVPMYSMKAQPVVSIVDVPDRLKKKSH